ncbi:M48 family metallopeptidase [Dokdonella immobilis]|uniref:Zn-dependent protease with chaperone function n=1 Tax=Dokdonella immobilis TaxID=578942 RepID=A0A1I4YYN7_9GAMM|nr:M48 family metallopeptidase [Dokdonella immobilis]SFN42913.1 Zn-dependent protease with chaperone function [Dokdonella immobilis]
MNFFAHQEVARKQTRRMIVLFTIAVICIVVAVDAVVMIAFGIGREGRRGAVGVNSGALVASTLSVIAVIGLATLYRISTLRAGGSAVALQLGATPVPADTTDFAYRRLRNVIEEIAIASGVPVPEIFVLEDEVAINAFASGYTPADAALTVTRGCLDKLTRDELQGVIAHEFSHVLNGDMRLNIRLVGVAFGILVLAIVGRKIAEVSGRSRSRDSGGIVVLGIALLVVGYIGVFFARIIKASISRQREYLADASAVQFTRQTEGIAGALKKIGGLAEGSKLASHDGEEVAHMLFGDGVGYSALFATHPPLVDRIKRLQPRFDPAEFVEIAADWTQPRRVGDSDDPQVSLAGFAPARRSSKHAPESRAGVLPAASGEMRLSATAVAEQVGHPDTGDYQAAATLNQAIPAALSAAAHGREQSVSVVFALLLNADDSVRRQQLDLIGQYYDAGTAAEVEALAAQTEVLHPMQRLPLAAMAFPALRRHPRPKLQVFVIVLKQLIKADGKVSLQEYCLAKLVGIQVIDALNPSATRVMGRIRLTETAAELRDLFSVVAEYGHDDAESARRAYVLGLNEVLPAARPSYAPPQDWALALDRALPRLDLLAPAGKELVVRGLTHAISADGVVSVEEAELLRTVCAALHCPLPPMLHQSG